MDRHPNDLTTDEEIDAAIERAKLNADEPLIVEAVYRPGPGLEFLELKLTDGRRLLIPREELGELKMPRTHRQPTSLLCQLAPAFGGRS